MGKQSCMNGGITPGLCWFDYSARGSYKFQSETKRKIIVNVIK